MNFSQPVRFRIEVVGDSFAIADAGGGSKFRGDAASRCPKLYVISDAEEEVPLYIGATIQPMRTRLRQGWAANGATGYYGYPWRTSASRLFLDIFHLLGCSKDDWKRELETVEAEVAFLVREAGQWPVGQTEIHFFPSRDWHREAAREIGRNYPGLERRRTLACTGRPAAPSSGEA